MLLKELTLEVCIEVVFPPKSIPGLSILMYEGEKSIAGGKYQLEFPAYG